MKEEKDHIDDFFKERSEQGSFEVPDSFLDDINSKLDVLDQKKKRRGGFFWLWTLIPIGLIMMYVLWPKDSQKSKDQINCLSRKSAEKSQCGRRLTTGQQWTSRSLTSILFEDSSERGKKLHKKNSFK